MQMGPEAVGHGFPSAILSIGNVFASWWMADGARVFCRVTEF